MNVTLSSLKPNPFRLFAVDPIDQEAVGALTESIKEDGFWGGVVCRVNDQGEIEVAAGHHRVAAAINAGISEADVFIGRIDDAAMIRIYARENATQRGNSSTAAAGSVAAAVRFLAKAQFLSINRQLSRNENKRQDIGEAPVSKFLQGVFGKSTGRLVVDQLVNLKKSGAYAEIIRDVQIEVDEILRLEQERIAEESRKEAKAREQAEAVAKREAAEAKKQAEFAKVKADEAKRFAAMAQSAKKEASRAAAVAKAKKAEAEQLAAENKAFELAKRQAVEAVVQQERKAALEAEAASLQGKRQKAMNAADKADEQDVTFDFAGVAKYFKNDHQLRAFRSVVLSAGVQPFVSVENQAGLAESLLILAQDIAKEKGGGADAMSVLTGAFIRDRVFGTLHGFKTKNKQAQNKSDKAAIERLGRVAKMKQLQSDFSRNERGLSTAGSNIVDLISTYPKGEPIAVSEEFKKSLTKLEWTVQMLAKHKLI